VRRGLIIRLMCVAVTSKFRAFARRCARSGFLPGHVWFVCFGWSHARTHAPARLACCVLVQTSARRLVQFRVVSVAPVSRSPASTLDEFYRSSPPAVPAVADALQLAGVRWGITVYKPSSAVAVVSMSVLAERSGVAVGLWSLVSDGPTWPPAGPSSKEYELGGCVRVLTTTKCTLFITQSV